jgi:hypothetical protein
MKIRKNSNPIIGKKYKSSFSNISFNNSSSYTRFKCNASSIRKCKILLGGSDMKEYKRYAEQEEQEDLRIVKGDGWYEIVNKKGDK